MPGAPHAGPARPAAITILLAALALGGPLAAAGVDASSAPVATPSAGESAVSPCTIEIVSPKEGQVLYGMIDLVATAACPRGATIDEVTLLVDGRVAGRSSRPPYRTAWDAGGSFIAHLIEARLGDAQGRAARAVLMTPGAALTEAVRVSSTPLDLVELSVTVADESGRFVHGLTRDDFVVEEGGREKRIESALPETRPLSVAVLVDVSDSTTDLWSPLRRAAPAFAGTLGPEDAAKVIAFSGSAYLVQEFTRDPGAIASSLERFRHWGGGTSLYDTLASAGVELAWGRGGRQAIVVLTDGIDTLSRVDAPRLRDYLRRTDVTIETFLLQPPGTTATPGYLRFKHDMETLCRETGGSLRVVADLDRIEAAFRDLGGELQNRTHLTYHSDRARRAGAWRTIRVRCRRPGLSVRTRAGTIGSRSIADYLVGDLRGGDAATRRKAAEWLGTVGGDRDAAQALLETLRDPSQEVRAAAAVSLGRLREPGALEPLVVLLSDPDDVIGKAAAEALRSFGPAAVPALLEALDHGTAETQVKTIGALAEIADTRAVDALTRLAQPPPPLTAARSREEERLRREQRADPRVRAWALWGLGRIGRPAAVPLLMKAAADPDPSIRQAALRALGEIGGREAIVRLLAGSGAGESDSRTRAAARAGLLAALATLARQGGVRAWVVSEGGAEAFLEILKRGLEEASATVPRGGEPSPRSPAPGQDLIAALGGREAVATILQDLASSQTAPRAEQARGCLARLP